MDKPLKALIRKQKNSSPFPAMDLGSGATFYVEQFALHYPKMKWYTTEWLADDQDGGGVLERETRAGLCLLSKEAKESLLLTDKNGCTIFWNDSLELHGLTRAEFNGLKGKITRKDSSTKGRYAVELENHNGPMSFKGTNIMLFA